MNPRKLFNLFSALCVASVFFAGCQKIDPSVDPTPEPEPQPTPVPVVLKGTNYCVKTAAELKAWADGCKDWDTRDTLTIMADIDLSSSGDWQPAGLAAGKGFCGLIAGGGHSISGCRINLSSLPAGDTLNVGFISRFSGDVKDLKFSGDVSTGSPSPKCDQLNVGGLFGAASGTMENVTCNCNVKSPGAYAGVLAGRIVNETIKSCDVSGRLDDGTVAKAVTFNNCRLFVYGANENSVIGGVTCKGEKAFLRLTYLGYYWPKDIAYDLPEYILDNVDLLVYSSCTIQENGSVKVNEFYSGQLDHIVKQCHGHGVKVMLSFGSPNVASIIPYADKRATVVSNLARIVDQYDLDGIDNDWEYPEAGKTDKFNDSFNAEMAAALKPKGCFVTMAINNGYWRGVYNEGTTNNTIIKTLDWVNVMSYEDINTYQKSFSSGDMMGMLVISHNYWVKERRIPEYQLVFGLCTEGVAYRDGGAKTTVMNFRQILNAGGDPDKDEYHGFSVQIGDYIYNDVYYNGRLTCRAKVDYLQSLGLGGVFFWELGCDSVGTSNVHPGWTVNDSDLYSTFTYASKYHK